LVVRTRPLRFQRTATLFDLTIGRGGQRLRALPAPGLPFRLKEKSMKLHRSIIGAAVAAALLAGSASAMADTAVTVEKTRHNYVYYKDRDVYFAPETKTYYWMANGSWRSGTAVPADYEPYVRSGGVTVELDTDRPYERHDYVVSRYKSAQPAETTTTERTGLRGS
jgi:hypothetical protein